jgi:hypothetical protein
VPERWPINKVFHGALPRGHQRAVTLMRPLLAILTCCARSSRFSRAIRKPNLSQRPCPGRRTRPEFDEAESLVGRRRRVSRH